MSLQVACVVRAFQHLHQRHIIYRDMQLGRSFKALRHTWHALGMYLASGQCQETGESSLGFTRLLQGTGHLNDLQCNSHQFSAVQPLSLKPVSTAQIGESDKPIYVSHFYAFVSPGCVTLLGSVWMLQSV